MTESIIAVARRPMSDSMTTTSAILKKILERKTEEVSERRRTVTALDLAARVRDLPSCRGFVKAVETKIAAGKPAVIAEAKKASPSQGVIRPYFDPTEIAISYEGAGATCLSVLTDIDFFQGSDEYLQAAKSACQIPVLRKDFIIDPYQVLEARVIGADCILLIVGAFDGDRARLRSMTDRAAAYGLDVLVEVHDAKELEIALDLPVKLIGINNRDLNTFKTSLQTTFDLMNQIPKDRIVVTESGINTQGDVAMLRARGVQSFLVGEAFMRAQDPGAKLKELFPTL